MTSSTIQLDHSEGRVSIQELGDGRRRVRVEEPKVYISTTEWETEYPVELIERILAVKGASYVLDEIRRAEDPDYVSLFLRYSLLGFLPEEAFDGARILDFGSGSGGTGVVLNRMFPTAQIVGVELLPEFIEIAKARIEYHGLDNVEVMQSPDPNELPADIGTFDFVHVGAVYEHLLPAERRRLLPQLWSVLKVGGVLFVNQLPHRFYVVEDHTTGVPLLNFLPDRLAHKAATRFSDRVADDATWPELLRAGIRGGTERSIARDITEGGGDPELLRPTRLGLRDHADLWYAYSAHRRAHPVKRAMRTSFRVVSKVTRTTYAPGLSVAVRKRA